MLIFFNSRSFISALISNSKANTAVFFSLYLLFSCNFTKDEISINSPTDNQYSLSGSSSEEKNHIKRPISYEIKEYISEEEYTLVRFDFSYQPGFGVKKMDVKTYYRSYEESFLYHSFKPFMKLVRDKDGHTVYKYYFKTNPKKNNLISEIQAYKPNSPEAIYEASFDYDINNRLSNYHSFSRFEKDMKNSYKVAISYEGDKMTEIKADYLSAEGLNEKISQKYTYQENLINPFYGLFFGSGNPLEMVSDYFPYERLYQKNMLSEEVLSLTQANEKNEFKLKYEYLETIKEYPLHYKVTYLGEDSNLKILKEVWIKYE